MLSLARSNRFRLGTLFAAGLSALSTAIEFSPTAATNFPTGGHLFSPLVATNLPTNRLSDLWCVS
jgi:hypothetical protein